MANIPSRQEIEELQDFSKKSCVSIYLPLERTEGANGMSNPNRIKLKNLLNEACEELVKSGASSSEAKKAIKRGQEILEQQHVFWPSYGGTVVVFIHEKMVQTYRLPAEIEQSLSVGQGFNTTPLEQFMKNNESYFLLTLSHNEVNLYEGDRFQLEQVELDDFPASMEETLNLDEYPKFTEAHPEHSSRTAERTGMQAEGYHGHYDKANVNKTLLVDFFRRIDKKLHGLLQMKNRPLVLAGVDYLIPLYKKVNTYNELYPEHLSGNFENSQLDNLRKKAWVTISKKP